VYLVDGGTELRECRPVARPRFQVQPRGVRVATGHAATLSVAATGNPPPLYQWIKDGVPLDFATNATLTLNPAQSADAGLYTVVISNVISQVTSVPARLTVAPVVLDVKVFSNTPSLVVQGAPDSAYTLRSTVDFVSWEKVRTLITDSLGEAVHPLNPAAEDAGRFFQVTGP
jgi:hypothetical protein